MQTLADAMAVLHKSEEYKSWKKDAFLAFAFTMLDADDNGSWQLGFYDGTSMTSFTIERAVKREASEEVFKTPDARILPLDLKAVKCDEAEALADAKKLCVDKYPGNNPQKSVIVLQNINGTQLWNISFITGTFNTVNIRIGAKDGKVISSDLVSVLSTYRK